MMEHRSQPLLARRAFVLRLLRYAATGLGILVVTLGAGVLGYHDLGGLPWIDAVLNASMILGGMGPVDPLHTTAGKVFASLYAIFCGTTLLIVIGVIMAPVVHRLMHRFHLDLDENAPNGSE